MNPNPNHPSDQYSLAKSFLYHILPGALVALFFVALKPLTERIAYPPLLAFLLAILLIDLPVMLGVLFVEGKKLNNRFSLEGVILYRRKVSWKIFIPVFLGAFVIVYLLIMAVSPLSAYLRTGIFSNLPDWIFLDEQSQYAPYTRSVLIAIFTLQLILTGLVLPWVEELYFRGFLLPRISRYGNWAPLIGGLFFGCYHIWQLFDFPTVFLLGTVLGYVVWWQKDLRLSISLHVVANLATRLMILLAALAM